MTVKYSEFAEDLPDAATLNGAETVIIMQNNLPVMLLVSMLRGAAGKQVELQNSGTYIQWRYQGDTLWMNLVALADLKGADGKSVEMRNDGTNIQWRLIGDASWTNLVALADLKGAPGPGIAPGGTTGQMLVKATNGDYNTTWADRPAAPPTNTDGLSEGTTNLYFTAQRVRSTPMTGIAFTDANAVVATDTLITAAGKLQAQVNARLPIAGGQMTGHLDFATPVNIASAASVAIGAAAANTVNITGTTTITGFDSYAAGARRRVKFAGVLTLTNNGAIMLPGGASIVTAANDTAEFESLGGGIWLCLGYQKANGMAVAISAPIVDIASASNMDVWKLGVPVARVTGTAAISYLGYGVDGQRIKLLFSGANTFNNSNVLEFPGQPATFTTAAGDTAEFLFTASNGKSTCIQYTRAARRVDLGTAALQDVITSSQDQTLGRVLTTGAGGILGPLPIISDAKALFSGGKFYCSAASGLPAGVSSYGYLERSFLASDTIRQEYTPYDSPSRKFAIHRNAGVWETNWTDISGFGVGQVWTDVTASRSAGTWYLNSTQRPIQIGSLWGVTSAANTVPITYIQTPAGTVDQIYGLYASAGTYVPSANVIVPPGHEYRIIIANGSADLFKWSELR